MISLNVDLGPRSYPIYIGQNLLEQSTLITQHIPGNSALIVSNETVAPLYMAAVEKALGDIRYKTLVLPDGEEHKNLDVLNTIFSALLENKLDRNTTLIALGGGVIGDITGFAAASYQRGVHLLQIPTTLLSQVDSSVGGKTAVNHPLGKNMIGAFYQPKAVIADTHTLNTLDDRQLSSGLAEVIKYGLIRDIPFLEWLEENVDKLLDKDPAALAYAIECSCQNKAEIVAADEKETGQRALLNLGHTFGHAIETGMGYGTWLHGEAVASGMVMAARLSNKLGWITEAEVDRVINILERANLPVSAPDHMSADQFIELMSLDKKVSDGVLKLVLYKSPGNAIISKDYTESVLRETIAESY
ncbi:3-dehydroquinate synthase [hydrothermal vent metagenome]|uniref:3-dehydroquinate synthase n=1 Tax=hydrothermal vent metagenome TaxID=652676 RepID=A0A3B0Y6W9_9ZZZZ